MVPVNLMQNKTLLIELLHMKEIWDFPYCSELCQNLSEHLN